MTLASVVHLFFLGAAALITSQTARAQFSTIEVGDAAISAYPAPLATDQTPFTTVNFAAPFASGVVPNVFTMTPEFGAGADDDPCLIRIRNVTNTGFDVTCFEPRNEDRAFPGVTFEYIAILNGTTTIPTTTGGSVLFESQCRTLNRQVSGPSCLNCNVSSGLAVGTQTVNFVNTFSSAPALLTELTTTQNTLSGAGVPFGEPDFLSVAVNSLGATGFTTSIDRLEAGNGLLTQTENMCYLAVARQGCQTLNLSGISGSVGSLNFQAVHGGNVDGHDNGNTSGEGATFAASCFSSTPVAVADMRTRAGNNGGLVRRASINASEIILTIDEDRVSDSERSHIDENVSVLAFSQTFTTPVTLSRVQIKQFGRRVRFAWQTTAESFNLGFHLWGETSQGWVQLNRKLIAGQRSNTSQQSDYKRSLRLTRQQYNEISRFGMSTVDSTGFEEFYGPFEAGQDYGEANTSEAIDWSATRADFDARMRAKGYVFVAGKWREPAPRWLNKQRRLERKAGSAIDVRFAGHGIRQIPGSSLLEQHPGWAGVKLSRLALTLNGSAVPRHIVSNDEYLSSDDQVIVNAIAPQGQDALYLKHYNYRLLLDRSKAIDASFFDGRNDVSASENGAWQGYAYFEQTLTANKRYSAAINHSDPWYDAELLAIGAPVNKTYVFTAPRPILRNKPAQLQLSLFGSLDLPGETPDHHVQVRVNGVLVHDGHFDGLTEHRVELALPAGLLTGDQDQLVVSVPGDTGLFADLVLVDSLTVNLPMVLDADLAADFPAITNSNGYFVIQEPAAAGGQSGQRVLTADTAVFAFSANGLLSVVQPVRENQALRFAAMPFTPSINKPDTLRYSVIELDRIQGPDYVGLSAAVTLHEEPSDLLVVAHPNFIGDELDAYLHAKRDEGYTPKVLNWLALVESYGYGNNTPNALNRFLTQASEFYQPQHMLLIGGHTFDYLDTLESGAVNFIPTHYRPVGIYHYSPSDNVFADLDADNRPDMAVGRWPVRSQADLAAIIHKSLTWQRLRASTTNQSAVLIAQANDGRNLNFEAALEGRIAPQLNALDSFSVPHKVYMGQLERLPSAGQTEPIQQARDQIARIINDGVDLVSFAGHASTAGWGFQGIVNTAFINDLRNHEHPVIVMPLACYTTHYQNLGVNTLAHQWLFAGTQGAAAIHGAAMLGEYRENAIFAERFLKQSRNTDNIGTAIMNAKRSMTSTNDMLHNWTLLGDPTLLLR